MKIIKSLKQGLLYKTHTIDGNHYLISSLLSCFSYAGPETSILPETELWKLLPKVIGDSIFDLGMVKPTGETLVIGSYYSPNATPVPVGKIRVQIATINKELVIWGDRFWKRPSSATWNITTPEPITTLPISYENCYGGADYLLNPIGKGYIDHKKLHNEKQLPLPNIESPAHLVVSPKDQPEPAGMGPLDLMWLQRSSKAGTYDNRWLNTRFPAYADDLEPSFFNTAPVDQQIDGFFTGDESFEIENMHHKCPLIKATLPGIKARCFINQKEGDDIVFKEIKTNLDTVWLFPNDKTGVLVYRGIQKVQDPDAEDVLYQMIAYESLKDKPKSISHYEKALALRLDREKGQYHLLNEAPIIPEGEKSGIAELITRDKKSSGGSKSTLEKNMQVRAERAKLETQKHLISLGIDPDKYFNPDQAQDTVPDFDIENIDQFLGEMDNLLKSAEEEQVAAEESMREKLTELGVDYEHLKENAASEAGPPQVGIEEKLELLKEFDLLTPEIETLLIDSQKKMDQTYREYGHFFPAGSPRSTSNSLQKREVVINGIKKGESFANVDLTGADLSHLTLQGADFSDAFLEGADFSGSDLSNANLSGCVLIRCTLNQTVFKSSILTAANLGQTNCHKTTFRDANMDNCVFYEAKIDNSLFENCSMEESDFSKASLSGSKVDKSNLNRSRFMETTFAEVSAKQASCRETIFLSAVWKNVDFSETDLTAATCVDVKGDATIFHRATLDNLRTSPTTQFNDSNFTNASLVEATCRDLDCTGSNFTNANLNDADFSKCRLAGSTFYRATACRTQFAKADLTSANMAGINLCEGSLQKACLHETDLHVANLYGVDFIEAKFRNTNISGANRNKAFLERWIKP